MASTRPYRIAIVGAGPAGFYAASALRRLPDLDMDVDLIERLPTPFGLVRYGVAPDHPKIKNVTRVYEKVAADPRVRLIANVTVGRDVTAADLHRFYDAVIYAVGAEADRQLGIPGEELAGCLASTTFVAWYNGHPDYGDFALDLHDRQIAIVGIGNVAIDVARILATSTHTLGRTDIADPALERLRESDVTDIHVLARRGVLEAKCTPSELAELGAIDDVDVLVDERDLVLSRRQEHMRDADPVAAKNLEILRGFRTRPRRNARCIRFRFLTSPIEVLGRNGCVSSLRVCRNEILYAEDGTSTVRATDEESILEVTKVVRAIGYRSVPIPGVPFDTDRAAIRNHAGRVVSADGDPVPREFVVGWAKRGPRGLIGTNKADAAETVEAVREDLLRDGLVPSLPADADAFLDMLEARGVRVVHYADWQLLDRREIARGAREGRPRVKFTRHDDMMRALDATDDDDQ